MVWVCLTEFVIRPLFHCAVPSPIENLPVGL